MSNTTHKASDYTLRNDRFMVMVLLLSYLACLALASWYDTWMEALVLGTLALSGALVMHKAAPGSLMARVSITVSLVMLVALQIHQAHGMIEVHFGVFVALAFLFTYRDWRLLLLGAVLFAIHHALFNLLQAQGAPVWVFDNDRLGWGIVMVHSVYVVAETVALIWLSRIGQEELRVSQEVIRVAEEVHLQNGALDLSHRCDEGGSPALARFNHMMSRFEQTVQETQLMLSELVNDVAVLRSSNQKMDALSRENTGMTEQIVVAMDQLSQSVNSISEHAQQTFESTELAVSENRICGNNMHDTKQSVNHLSQSLTTAGDKIQALAAHCREISTVVSVIQGVAEQTNLLALNAAIEAARAGEQGRGFAVVADEVRALASRTSESTREINHLITNLQNGSAEAVEATSVCQNLVQNTENQSDEVVHRLAEINGALANMNDRMRQVATAVGQQSAVSQEVARNANGIQEATQAFAQSASEGYQGIVNAERRAVELQKTLSAFRVSGSD